MLQIAVKVSGIAAGAFSEDGQLIGLVYGLTGFKHGALHHWSHMLAVDGTYRDHGIGRALKMYQRRELEKLGVSSMSWTYDPLVARNAHLNLINLGAQVVEYERDVYGEDSHSLTDSIIGSDRFVVDWHFGKPDLCHTVEASFDEDSPILNTTAGVEEKTPSSRPYDPAVDNSVRIEIPQDIQFLKLIDPDRARRIRADTRDLFERFLERGFRVRAFALAPDGNRAWYTLSNDETKGKGE